MKPRARGRLWSDWKVWLKKETGNAQPGACVDVLPRCWVRVTVRVRVTYLNQTGLRHQILGGIGVRVLHSRSDAPSWNPTHSILNCFFPLKLKTLSLLWTFHQETSYKKSKMSCERRMSVWWMESSDDCRLVRHVLCQVLKHGDEPSDCDSSFPCYYRAARCLHYALCSKN